MNYNDRELFVYRIISGVVKVKVGSKTIKVFPPTTQVYLEACELYAETFDRCYVEGLKDEEEMRDFMIEADLWSWHDEKEVKEIKTAIEDLKLEAYEKRQSRLAVNQTKNTLLRVEARRDDLMTRKNRYFSQTCEGIASLEKLSYIVENSSFYNDKLYNFADTSLENIIIDYNRFHNINDHTVRLLAREEPWRTLWVMNNKVGSSHFSYPELEMTVNQKSLLVWSQMYDNVYESIDCPIKEVIEDDILLDGWFIFQSRKRDKDKLTSDIEGDIKSEKIKNSSEVFSIVGGDKGRAKRIDSLNTPQAKMIKKEREQTIESKGGKTGQGAFRDEKMKLAMQSNTKFKGKVGG